MTPEEFKLVAPLGTEDFLGAKDVRAQKFKITAAIPHINTIKPLKAAIEILRLQTERPYILVIDTGSPPDVLEELEAMRAPDLEIHRMACHSYAHSSEPVTMALDIAHAVCRTPYLFHTHSDCFLRRRDFLESVMRVCNSNTPVIGYRMSERSWITDEWRYMVGHTATLLYLPTLDRTGARWSFQKMRAEFFIPIINKGGWPDTETGFNMSLKKHGIRPVFIGYDINNKRQVDDNIDHVRSYAGSGVYSPKHRKKSTPWMEKALIDATARINAWESEDGMPSIKTKVKIIDETKAQVVEYGGRKHLRIILREKDTKKELVCAMHRRENTNNLEVLRMAVWCDQNNVRLVMYGTRNQLPLLGIFADTVILEDAPNTLAGAYEDVKNPGKYTEYQSGELPKELKVIDLCRQPAMLKRNKWGDTNPQGWPEPLRKAAKVSDAAVVKRFAKPDLYVFKSSAILFRKLVKRGAIPKGALACEVKRFKGCDGADIEQHLQECAESIGMPMRSREDSAELAKECGQHYMAVQVLASIAADWKWVCYGGSANLFAFFPFKTLLLSDAYVQQKLARALAVKRFGITGQSLPFFTWETMEAVSDKTFQWAVDAFDSYEDAA